MAFNLRKWIVYWAVLTLMFAGMSAEFTWASEHSYVCLKQPSGVAASAESIDFLVMAREMEILLQRFERTGIAPSSDGVRSSTLRGAYISRWGRGLRFLFRGSQHTFIASRTPPPEVWDVEDVVGLGDGYMYVVPERISGDGISSQADDRAISSIPSFLTISTSRKLLKKALSTLTVEVDQGTVELTLEALQKRLQEVIAGLLSGSYPSYTGLMEGQSGFVLVDSHALLAKELENFIKLHPLRFLDLTIPRLMEGIIFDHHGPFDERHEVNSAMLILEYIEARIGEGGSSQELVAGLQRTFRYLSTDNLGDASLAIWILHQLDRVVEDRGFRETLKRVAWIEDFGLFGRQVLKMAEQDRYWREAVEIDFSILQTYQDILAHFKIATGDRFNDLEERDQQEVLRQALEGITRSLDDSRYREERNGAFRESVSLAVQEVEYSNEQWMSRIRRRYPHFPNNIYVFSEDKLLPFQVFSNWHAGAVANNGDLPLTLYFKRLPQDKDGHPRTQMIMAVVQGHRDQASLEPIATSLGLAESKKRLKLHQGHIKTDSPRVEYIIGRSTLVAAFGLGLLLTPNEIMAVVERHYNGGSERSDGDGVARDEKFDERLVWLKELVELHESGRGGGPGELQRSLRAVDEAAHLSRRVYKESVFPDTEERYIDHAMGLAGEVVEWGAGTAATAAALLSLDPPTKQARRRYREALLGLDPRIQEEAVEIIKQSRRVGRLVYNSSPHARYAVRNHMEKILKLLGDYSPHEVLRLVMARKLFEIGSVRSDEALSYLDREIMLIWAPLAERFGRDVWAAKLRDEAFRFSDPEGYQKIADAFERATGLSHDEGRDYIEEIQRWFVAQLEGRGVSAAVQGRVKGLRSMHEKSLRKHKQITDFPDLFGLMVVLEEGQRLPIDHTRKIAKKAGSLMYRKMGLHRPRGRAYEADRVAVQIHMDPDAPLSGPMLDESLRQRVYRSLEIQVFTPGNYRKYRRGTVGHWRFSVTRLPEGQHQSFDYGAKFPVTGNFERDVKTARSAVGGWTYVDVEGNPTSGLVPIRLKKGATAPDAAAHDMVDKMGTAYGGAHTLVRYVVRGKIQSGEGRRPIRPGVPLQNGQVLSFYDVATPRGPDAQNQFLDSQARGMVEPRTRVKIALARPDQGLEGPELIETLIQKGHSMLAVDPDSDGPNESQEVRVLIPRAHRDGLSLDDFYIWLAVLDPDVQERVVHDVRSLFARYLDVEVEEVPGTDRWRITVTAPVDRMLLLHDMTDILAEHRIDIKGPEHPVFHLPDGGVRDVFEVAGREKDVHLAVERIRGLSDVADVDPQFTLPLMITVEARDKAGMIERVTNALGEIGIGIYDLNVLVGEEGNAEIDKGSVRLTLDVDIPPGELAHEEHGFGLIEGVVRSKLSTGFGTVRVNFAPSSRMVNGLAKAGDGVEETNKDESEIVIAYYEGDLNLERRPGLVHIRLQRRGQGQTRRLDNGNISVAFEDWALEEGTVKLQALKTLLKTRFDLDLDLFVTSPSVREWIPQIGSGVSVVMDVILRDLKHRTRFISRFPEKQRKMLEQILLDLAA